MIRHFTTVYPGHVDLPDRGQNATPANERRYSNEHLASARLLAGWPKMPGERECYARFTKEWMN